MKKHKLKLPKNQQRRTARLNVCFTPDEFRELTKKADRYDISRADLIRHAISMIQ